ncbi:uncharacterized protein LOC128241546 isoform X3 [Mya arenaria]|uniref:uncharacterized protein LOC128241546 isoform X3 n=1 Tax=Mya arenaria TaxID=6604 RepID=UPI0022E68E83|nr:uncharacterized protein LOC128241546 isoform X3 [Mya arenaria]
MMSVEALYLGILVCAAVGGFNKRAATSLESCGVSEDALKRELGCVCISNKPKLDVRYGRNNEFQCDKTYSKSDTSSPPTEVSFNQAEAENTYSLLMVDPDAPGHSLEKLTFFLHWAVTGITITTVLIHLRKFIDTNWSCSVQKLVLTYILRMKTEVNSHC